MVKEPGFGLGISEFESKACYYIYFQINNLRKDMNPLISPSIDKIALLLFFYEVVIPLNKETKPSII